MPSAATSGSPSFASSTSGVEDIKPLRVPPLSAFMGAIPTKDDEVMLFDVANLLEDSTPCNAYDDYPYSFGMNGEMEDCPIDSALLDKASADLCNMHILNTPELERTDSLDFPDLVSRSALTPAPDLVDSSSDGEMDTVSQVDEMETKVKVEEMDTERNGMMIDTKINVEDIDPKIKVEEIDTKIKVAVDPPSESSCDPRIFKCLDLNLSTFVRSISSQN